MCSKATNPVAFLQEHSVDTLFRFILTHPDMDHMDGIRRLFTSVKVANFWDCGIRKAKPEFESQSRYLEDDWDYYDSLIAGSAGIHVVSPRSGDKGAYWASDGENGQGNGDYLSILSPTEDLITAANSDGDINDACYVICYRSSAGKVIFAGDSNDKVWEHILEHHGDLVADTSVLFAPHHGRKSDRSFSFLDEVKPRLSFFGCAPSDYLAYSAWSARGLLYFTNNQCGNVLLLPSEKKMNVYIQNKEYATAYTGGTTWESEGFWYLCTA